MSRSEPRIAVLGAGPVGIEAALYAASLNLPVRVYERGSVGDHGPQWHEEALAELRRARERAVGHPEALTVALRHRGPVGGWTPPPANLPPPPANMPPRPSWPAPQTPGRPPYPSQRAPYGGPPRSR